MHAFVVYVCRVVIAVSLGGFVAGWIICAKIQSDALSQPTHVEGDYIHPLPMKRSNPRFITQSQHEMLAVWRPVLMGSWAFAFLAFLVMGAVDDARRDNERKHDHLPHSI